MAIYHLSMEPPITRGNGQCAVASAAYRHTARMTDERTGQVWDFTRKRGCLHSELSISADAPPWARELLERHAVEPAAASEALWNRVELFEKRKDAQLAREIRIALPAELTLEQNIALTREFVTEQLASHGLGADWAIHDGRDGNRNFHAHILLTMRPLAEAGFEAKRVAILDPETGEALRDKRGRIRYDFTNTLGAPAVLVELRKQWADYANLHLARAGHGVSIDHRSHADAGLDVTPTVHKGVQANAMAASGQPLERIEDFEDARAEGAREIAERPERVLELITHRQAVFTRRDIAREINRYVDEGEAFQATLARVMASPELKQLAAGEGRAPARFSTRAMIQAERDMMAEAQRLARARTHGVSAAHVEAALKADPDLSAEQRAAVRHVTGRERIAAVAGAAGAGKSRMLRTAKAAWEGQGFTVRGAALAGKAADGLQKDAGIKSRTIASLEWAWAQGRERLGPRDVLVIDEAGMTGSRQLGRVLAEARKSGAKVVLVGDARQLQPIEAGAPFRAIVERIGFASIETIIRQREEWARKASMDLAQGRVQTGLAAYQERGHVRFEASREEAKRAIARDWMAGRKDGKDTIVLAHTRADVRDLNAAIRKARADAGELGEAAAFQTGQGKREFAAGDRIVFLKNDRELGVKNGTLGTVEAAEENRLTVALDGDRKDSRERVTVEAHAYAEADHGYAVTIHKSQGATVDRAFVLASGGMDRHLTYVAMTRHREQATLYGGRDDFENHKEMAWRVSRRRTNETTLDFAERRGIDTVRDWIGNGRALLNRARDRFEQAAARIGERLGLGRSLREELRERQPGKQAPAGAGAASGDMERWTAAIEAEAKAVRAKARRAADLAEKRKAAIGKKQEAHKQAMPKEPGRFSLPGTQKRYDAEMGMWTKERDRLERALKTAQRRGAFASKLTEETVRADYPSEAEKLAKQRIKRRHPELDKAIRAEREQQNRERAAEIRQGLEKQRKLSQERGGRGH
jgi:Ti-type conjugative transfer relaxase TraA